MVKVSKKKQYQHMEKELNEKQWRHYLAMEAKRLGKVAPVAKKAGVSVNTVKRGIREVERGDIYTPGSRVRGVGGGRKKTTVTDTKLLSDLDSLIDHQTKGNPMNFIKGTSKSLEHVTGALNQLGHAIKQSAVYNLLVGMKYRLTGNRKDKEGKQHADRDEQFQEINLSCEQFTKDGNPIISIDCKKKEYIGNFKNNGKEWTKQGQQLAVNAYDFASLAEGVAHPYGVYDRLKKLGFVNVGIDANTAPFAVESIRR